MNEIKPIVFPKLKRDTIKNLSQGIFIFLVISFYTLFDKLTLTFEIELFLTFEYWATLILNTTLIIIFILSVRQVRKDFLLNKHDKIKDTNGRIIFKPNQFEIYMSNLSMGYNKITKEGLSDKLDIYLLDLNKDKKYNLYQQSILYHLEKIKQKITPEMVDGIKKDKRKSIKLKNKQKNLEQLLLYDKDYVWEKIKFKYNKITISKLFSSISGRVIDDDETNIDPQETKAINRLITHKVLWVLVFGAGTGTIIPALTNGFYWLMIFSIVIKLITLLMAANLAMADADDFVNVNLKISLQRRIRILADFYSRNNMEKLKLDQENEETKKTEI